MDGLTGGRRPEAESGAERTSNSNGTERSLKILLKGSLTENFLEGVKKERVKEQKRPA